MIFNRIRELIARWRAKEIDDQMGQLLPVESSPLLMSRRRFLQTVVPAALVMPVLADELLHPGRSFFLPSQSIEIVPDLALVDVEGIIKRQLAEETAAIVDANVWSMNSLGGYFYSRELAKVLRTSFQPLTRFRQVA